MVTSKAKIEPPIPAAPVVIENEVPEPAGSGRESDFTCPVTLDGESVEVTVPSLRKAPRPNTLALEDAKLRKDNGRTTLLFVKAACKGRPEAWDTLTQIEDDELVEFFKAWAAHSGVSVPE